MQELGTWTTKGARTWGIALIVGVLLPIVVLLPGMKQIVWPWTTIAESPLILLPLLFGIAAVAISYTMSGIAQGITLFLCGVGVMLLSVLLSLLPKDAMQGITFAPDSNLLALAFFISVIGIAVGNHLRKVFPDGATPRLLAGICGCVLVLLFVVPFAKVAPISFLFEPLLWKAMWPMQLVTLAFFAYGVVGALSFIPFNDVTIHCRTISILSRVVLVGFPTAFLLMLLIHGGPEGMFVPLMLGIVNLCAILYGVIALPAVGLTSWTGHALGAKGAAAR